MYRVTACEVSHLKLTKKDFLFIIIFWSFKFMVPFFSWISLAFGGVPVDRGNRERAVSALHRASSAAKNNQICIVIAPEGMRSTTGQLLPFKKGTYRPYNSQYAHLSLSWSFSWRWFMVISKWSCCKTSYRLKFYDVKKSCIRRVPYVGAAERSDRASGVLWGVWALPSEQLGQ